MDEIFAGRYRIVRRIGAGAMGAVYEAIDLRTLRKRALKIMHAHMIDRPEPRERFAMEARITGSIQSPFIVDVVDAGVAEDGTPFLAMELLRGEDLSRRLRRAGPFSPEEALSILSQVAAALDETHRAGIVHRDLKPANLFLQDRAPDPPRVKVLDFGVAKILTSTLGSATGSAGTPVYMAPEQFRGGHVGPAADVFALGMTAFALFTGHPYWEPERDRSLDVMAFALVAAEGPAEPASARARRSGVALAEAFDPWFARVTARAPGDRFPTAGAAVRGLADALGVAVSLPDSMSRDPESDEEEGLSRSRLLASTTLSAEGSKGTETAPAFEKTGPPTAAPGEGSTGSLPAEGLASREASIAPGPAGPRERRGRAIAAWIVAAGAVIATGLWVRGEPLDRPSSPPLSTSGPVVVACPIFSVEGVGEPSGWLGAAAASTFCERARIVLGGAVAHTVSPAELLDLPPRPSEQIPEDPFAGRDARDRSLRAARERGVVRAEGLVARETGGFRVEITLRRPDGSEMDRGRGSGRALYEAVRAAMTPMVASGSLPMATSLDPTLAEIIGANDVSLALQMHDLSFALAQNAGSVKEECARADVWSRALPFLGPGERFRCAYTLGLPAPEVTLPPGTPRSWGALAARARVRLMVQKDSDPDAAMELERLLASDVTPLGKSMLAATASCLSQAKSPERARELALLAVQSEPRNTAGEWCAPWIQAAVITQGTSSAPSVLRAMRAWAPWDPYGWVYEATAPGDAGAAVEVARRAYVLSPLDAFIASTLAGRLISAGAREEARAVAVALASGGHPVHRVGSDQLLLQIDASQARFGAALSRAKLALRPSPDDAGWVRVQRLDIAWRALQIALLVGRSAEIADLAVESLILPEPSPLDGASIEVPLRVPAICARASAAVAKRCFARFPALRERLSLGALPDTDTFVRGAERHAAGDFKGAAAAWRSLVRDPGPYVILLGDAMCATFEHSGESDLAERLDAAGADDGAETNGASLKTVRAARRAAKKGDRAGAAALAEKVIRAWSVADEDVPVLAEMRRLARP